MGIYGTSLYGTGVYGADPTQLGVNDLRVELFLPQISGTEGAWAPYTGSVRTQDGISLSRGRTSEEGDAGPAQCSLTFDNRDGWFSPRNPASPLLGKIGRNTPIRVGMGNPVVGSVTSGGLATIIPLSQIATSYTYGPVATMAVTMSTSMVNFTTPAGYSNSSESDPGGKFTVRRSFGTDSGVVPAVSVAASVATFYGTAHVAVPNGTFASAGGGNGIDGGATGEVDLSLIPEGDLLVAVCGWTTDASDRMGPPVFNDDDVPVELYMVADSGPSTRPRVVVWAWRHRASVGSVYLAGALDNDTGATIQVAQFTGADRYTPRFTGEISEWPIAWTPDAGDIITPVTAGGVQRRMVQSTDETSALRGAFEYHSDITAYWPMEDPEGSAALSPAIGTSSMVYVNGGAPGQVEAIAGSLPTPDFTGRGARAPITPANSPPWGFGGAIGVPEAGLTPGTNLLTGECGGSGVTVSTFVLEYTTSTTLTFKVQYSSGATASTSVGSLSTTFPNGVNGREVFVYISATQNGANVDWSVTVSNITPAEPFAQLTTTGSLAAQTIGPLAAVTVATEAGGSSTLGINGLTAGHVFVTAGNVHTSSIYRRGAARGWAGFPATEVAYAIARDHGYKMALFYPPADVAVSGVIYPGNTLQGLKDLEFAVQATMSDAAGFVGLEWKPLPVLESKTPVFTFAYAGDTFAGIMPIDDDALLLNDVTVTSTVEGRARVQVEDGKYGTQAGGVGRYARDYTVPVVGQDAAAGLAGWLTHLGTVDAARWPNLELRMSGAGVASLNIDRLGVGDTIRVSGLPTWAAGVSTVDLIVVGFTETIDAALWTVTLHTRLAQGYDVATPELAAEWDTVGDDNDATLYPPIYLGMG